MTHQEIQDNDVIEQYVRHKLSPVARRAFQEHFFECDECFQQTNVAARFIAGVRDASRIGVLSADRTARPVVGSRWLPFGFREGWAIPALALVLLVAVALIGLWALSLKRENQRLAQRTPVDDSASEQLQRSEAKIRELEASDRALKEQSESLRKENSRLKEQVATTAREQENYIAQLRQPDINVPVRNIYPLGDALRSDGIGEINKLNVPRGTRTFVLILGDYKPGYTTYRLEIRESSGRLVAQRGGLKSDQNGELSVMLNRTLLRQGKYRLKLYGGKEAVAEYVVEVE